METMMVALAVAAVVGAAGRIRHIADAVMAGVELHLPAPPAADATRGDTAGDGGGHEERERIVLDIRVTGTGSVRFESRTGDVGPIRPIPDGDGRPARGATVVLPLRSRSRTGSRRAGRLGISSRLGHVLLGALLAVHAGAPVCDLVPGCV